MNRPALARPAGLRLGLRANLAQFSLLIGINALVGGMVGQERSLLSLLATQVFGLAAVSAALTHIVAFGLTKAVANFLAGTLADRYGRKPVLVAGWLTGLRPEPFYLGLAYAGLGLGLSTLLVRETRGHAHLEAQLTDAQRPTAASPGTDSGPGAAGGERLSTREVMVRTSLREPALSACSQAGLVNNLNDGLAWGLLPLLFVRGGLSVAQVGLLAALYPAVRGLGQLVTGPLSDRLGRKPLITAGMLLQAVALAGYAVAGSFLPWAASAVLHGVGTAMVYPTLLAAISDVAHPSWRASAVGVYPSTIQPVVAASRLPDQLRDQVRELLVGLGDDPSARPALDHGFIQGFTAVDDTAYDDIRAMLATIQAAGWTSLTRGL